MLLLVSFYVLISLASCTIASQDDLELKYYQLERKLNTITDEYGQKFSRIINENHQREQDLEARVAKLEELIRVGTLRSCAEYSQYGLKTDGLYMIDPDGPLLGHPPFQVFCNFTSGIAKPNLNTK